MATPRPTEARLLRQVVRDIEALLPSDWTITTLAQAAGRDRPDLVAVVRGPDGAEAALIVEAKRTLLPRDAADAVRQLRSYADRAGLKDASTALCRTDAQECSGNADCVAALSCLNSCL